MVLPTSMKPRAAVAGAALLVWAALTSAGFHTSAGEKPKRTLQFAAEMAKVGNWREAQFRWEGLARTDPDNPRILNNLAVAAEALGDPENAREYYARAVAAGHGDDRIAENKRRFDRFWRQVDADFDADPPGEAVPVSPQGKPSRKGKAMKVSVSLPVPPRMDLETARTVLVASFLAPDSGLLDFDHELVRFLRSKLGKSKLEVLRIVPAPAVPEQTLEDLIANSEFWKHLGREYDADLIVSGAVIYGRQDASGFVDVDRVSEVTGQKVRTTEFVEQEEFSYALDVIFMDGAAGTLRYRDRLQRSAVYRGTQNDPIEAFFQINESLSADLMAIVQPRQRLDPRIVFKN
jgi:hypothetical protein